MIILRLDYKYLHSTIFILKPFRIIAIVNLIRNLHSTIFILKLQAGVAQADGYTIYILLYLY